MYLVGPDSDMSPPTHQSPQFHLIDPSLSSDTHTEYKMGALQTARIYIQLAEITLFADISIHLDLDMAFAIRKISFNVRR